MEYWKVWNYSIFLCLLFLIIVSLVDSGIEEEGSEKEEVSPKDDKKKKKVTFNLPDTTQEQIKFKMPKKMLNGKND